MEEALENSKESSHSAHANGIDMVWDVMRLQYGTELLTFQNRVLS
jgi:hypothetical protein